MVGKKDKEYMEKLQKLWDKSLDDPELCDFVREYATRLFHPRIQRAYIDVLQMSYFFGFMMEMGEQILDDKKCNRFVVSPLIFNWDGKEMDEVTIQSTSTRRKKLKPFYGKNFLHFLFSNSARKKSKRNSRVMNKKNVHAKAACGEEKKDLVAGETFADAAYHQTAEGDSSRLYELEQERLEKRAATSKTGRKILRTCVKKNDLERKCFEEKLRERLEPVICTYGGFIWDV